MAEHPQPKPDEQVAGKSYTEGGLKNSLHGIAYQLKLLLMVVLQASKLMQQDDRFRCTISTEDPDEGKFDDVVFRYRYRGDERVLNIQAKHKGRSEQTVSWEDLANSSTNAPFSLVKYFASFLKQRKKDAATEQRLVLCTNADLQDTVKKQLQLEDTEALQQDDLCYIFKLIQSTGYRLNVHDPTRNKELSQIIELLRECSDCYGLAKLLARTIYHETKLDLNTKNVQRAPLLTKHRAAIESHLLGEKREKTVYNVREDFCNGTMLHKSGLTFRRLFEVEYKKLCPTGVDMWADVRAKGIILKETPKPCQDRSLQPSGGPVLPDDIVTDAVIEEFSRRFLLVCGSLSEDQLSQTVMEFWRATNADAMLPEQMDDAGKHAAYNELLRVVFDWMKEQKQPPTPLTKADIKQLFERIGFGIQYPELRCVSRIYLEGMRLESDPMISFVPERVQQTALFGFLCSVEAPAVFSFPAQGTDFRFALVIVLKIIDSFTRNRKEGNRLEVLFVEYATYQKYWRSIESILRLTNISIILVIVCSGETQDWDRTFERYSDCGQKIILVQRAANSFRETGRECLLVSDLTEDCAERLLEKKTELQLFGTKISLTQMVDRGDGLMTMLELLECFSLLEKEPSLLQQKFETISDWYILRTCQPYISKKVERRSINRLVDSSIFKEGALLDFDSFFIALKRALRLELFEGWHITHIIRTNHEGAVHEPPGIEGNLAMHKAHILMDEAGYGKSTYLSWLGWYLQRKCASWWIIRLNAIEYSMDLSKILDRGELDDGLQALRVLFQFMHLALFVPDINRRSVEETDRERERAEQCASLLELTTDGQVRLDEEGAKRARLSALQWLELRLFRAKFNAQQLVLLFDGFDEIVPYYKQLVYRLFGLWHALRGIYRMYLTSRPYDLKQELEGVFQEMAKFHRLQPFNKESRLLAIHIFLSARVGAKYKGCSDERRNALLGSLEAILRCYLSELRNTPLFIRVALETLFPLVQQYVDFESGTISGRLLDAINTNLEKLHMVETFVESKFFIAHIEKVESTEAARQTAYALDNMAELNRRTHRMHSLLALYVLFNDYSRSNMLSDAEKADALEYMQNVRQGSVKSGLIEGIHGFVPVFVHRTFAEYFAAHWLYERARHGGSDFKAALFSELQILQPSRAGMREFFDRMFIKEAGQSRELHWAAINRSFLDLRSLLKGCPTRAYELDAAGRTFLHLLALYIDDDDIQQNLDLFALIESGCVDIRDRLQDWSALDYAFLVLTEELICHLIRKGATINVEAMFDQLLRSQNNAIEVLHTAQFHEKVLSRFRFNSGTKRYLSEVPWKVARYLACEKHLELGLNHSGKALVQSYQTALGYCVATDTAVLLRCFIEQAGGLRKIPVDRVIRQAFIDQAIHVMQYLIVQCGHSVPSNLVGRALFEVLTKCIECHYRKLFHILLARFRRRKRHIGRMLRDVPKHCVRLWSSLSGRLVGGSDPGEDFESISFRPWVFEHTVQLNSYVLRLLCTCVASGNMYALVYLLQATETRINNALIVCIMKAVAAQHTHGQAATPPLVYLIDRSQDLCTLDREGHSLLQHTIEAGWVAVAIYLIEQKGFELAQAPLWCVARQRSHLHGWVLLCRLQMFQYLIDSIPDVYAHCVAPSDNGTSVFEVALSNRHFSMVKLILKAAVRDPDDGIVDRSDALVKLFKNTNTIGKQECHEFLHWLTAEDNQHYDPTWQADFQATYDRIRVEECCEISNSSTHTVSTST